MAWLCISDQQRAQGLMTLMWQRQQKQPSSCQAGSIDSLAKQLGAFGCLCGAWGGKHSNLQTEMDDWVARMLKYEQMH